MTPTSHLEFLRLHCDHLRTLIEQLSADLTILGCAVTTHSPPSYAPVAPHIRGLRAQGQQLAREVVRLQDGLRALEAKCKAGEAERLP